MADRDPKKDPRPGDVFTYDSPAPEGHTGVDYGTHRINVWSVSARMVRFHHIWPDCVATSGNEYKGWFREFVKDAKVVQRA